MSQPTNPAIGNNVEFFTFDPAETNLHLNDGRHLDGNLIEELAAQAETTGPPPGLVPGGKSLSGHQQHSPQITVVLPEEVNRALRACAKAERMSVSRWTRRLIERELSRVAA